MMDVRPLHSEADYDLALREIEQYFDLEPIAGTDEADGFDLLALVIADYEAKQWPIDPPDPIEAIKARMQQTGYCQKDLATLVRLKVQGIRSPFAQAPTHHRDGLEA